MYDFPNPPLTVGQQALGPNGAVWQWDGTKWEAAPGALTQALVVIGDSPPASPANGQLWFDSVGSQLYCYYTDPTSSQWVLATSPPFPPAQVTAGNVGRNFVHNSMMNVAQRSAGNFTAIGYTLDRWLANFTGGSITVSQQALTDAYRSAIGDEAARYGLQYTFTGTSGVNDFCQLVQRMEWTRRLSGKTITVSFWASASAALKLGVSLYQSMGTGGSPSGGVQLAGQAVNLTTTMARYSLTFAMPSTAGMTFGSNGDDWTQLGFWFSNGGSTYAFAAGNIGPQSGTVMLWGMQLEIGSGFGFPTPLEKIDPQQDLARCQRFYQTGQVRVVGYSAGSGEVLGQSLPFLTTMRAGPTVTPNWSSQTNCTGTIAVLDATTCYPYAQTTAAGQISLQGSFTASADL